jgi:hypothetical protein
MKPAGFGRVGPRRASCGDAHGRSDEQRGDRSNAPSLNGPDGAGNAIDADVQRRAVSTTLTSSRVDARHTVNLVAAQVAKRKFAPHAVARISLPEPIRGAGHPHDRPTPGRRTGRRSGIAGQLAPVRTALPGAAADLAGGGRLDESKPC